MPSVFRTEELSLPSAFCAEGLFCLRLFARQDFPRPRHFVLKDFSAFGFSHDRTFLTLGISRRRTSRFSVSVFGSPLQCNAMLCDAKIDVRDKRDAIAMSKEREGLA